LKLPPPPSPLGPGLDPADELPKLGDAVGPGEGCGDHADAAVAEWTSWLVARVEGRRGLRRAPPSPPPPSAAAHVATAAMPDKLVPECEFEFELDG